MVDDGLYEKHQISVPDFVLGHYVMAMRAGSVESKMGTIMTGADSIKITLFGVGGHASQVSLPPPQYLLHSTRADMYSRIEQSTLLFKFKRRTGL